jgi:hypothetical protein
MNSAGSKIKIVNITFNEARFIADFVQAIRPALARANCPGLVKKSKTVERTIYLACARARMCENSYEPKIIAD